MAGIPLITDKDGTELSALEEAERSYARAVSSLAQDTVMNPITRAQTSLEQAKTAALIDIARSLQDLRGDVYERRR